MPIATIIKQAKKYLPHLDEKRLKAAYNFAMKAHEGQKRMDGMPYITHPTEVALILLRLRVDEDTLIACFLHDVIEDTPYTIKDVEQRFGKNVAFLVKGVTKLSKVKYRHDMLSRQIDSLRKFFLHSARDLRIILIKLADRLHNMRTLSHVHKEKQLRIAKETMEIYVPIANLLGVWELKSDLENLCFFYIHPNEYKKLAYLVEQNTPHQEKLLADTTHKVMWRLKKIGIQAEVDARPKSLYSIFRKMVDKGQRFQDINDLLAVRVVVKDRETCYRVLGVIHSLFPPKSSRVKDYIAVPKANGYQSLHTTVFGINGAPTEFQIRTNEMHFEAEYGIASHFFYKELASMPSSTFRKEIKKRSTWVKKVLELQRELKSNFDFLENLKVDIFQDRIFVFTPYGDVVDLPQGAIGIDFAYHIHTNLGDHAVRLRRNGDECSVTTVLKTGDVVEVLTSPHQKLPKREWLDKIKTSLARHRIKEALKQQSSEQCHRAGTNFMKKELHLYGVHEIETLPEEKKKQLVEFFRVKNWHEFLEMVGNGSIPEDKIIENLYTKEEILGPPARVAHPYSLAKSGDRKNEPRLTILATAKSTAYYRVKLFLKVKDRVGLLRDVGIQLANLNVNIHQVNVSDTPMDKTTSCIVMVVEVLEMNQLRNVFNALSSTEDVQDFYLMH